MSDLPVLSPFVIPAHCQPGRPCVCTISECPQTPLSASAHFAQVTEKRSGGDDIWGTFVTGGKSQDLMHLCFLLVGKDVGWVTAVSNTHNCALNILTTFSSSWPPVILATSHHQQSLAYPSRNIYDREFLDHTVSKLRITVPSPCLMDLGNCLSVSYGRMASFLINSCMYFHSMAVS